MTAAILQFQPIQPMHTSHTQANDQSDYMSLPMTKEYHTIILDMLNKENPFKAIRLATEFNRENGFELISYAQIKLWKREIGNQNNEILKNEMSKMEKLERGYTQLLKIKINKL
jgi:hypothetical protein